MIQHPPPVAGDWPPADRLAYIAWLARLTLHRIDLDDPAVPVLSKRPVRALFHAVAAVADRQAEALEADRAALLKPFDAANNYHSVALPPAWLAKLAELAAEDLADEPKGGTG